MTEENRRKSGPGSPIVRPGSSLPATPVTNITPAMTRHIRLQHERAKKDRTAA